MDLKILLVLLLLSVFLLLLRMIKPLSTSPYVSLQSYRVQRAQGLECSHTPEPDAILSMRNYPSRISSAFSPPFSPLHFTIPHVIESYYDPFNSSLHVYLNGIDMGPSQRNLSAVACVLDDMAYDAYLFSDDVLHCKVPNVTAGMRIRVLVLQNDALMRARKGVVTLKTGVEAVLGPADIIPIPKSINLSYSKYSKSEVNLVSRGRRALRHESIRTKRWRVCLMTQIAPSAWMLPQWVSYHRRIGVDYVYIFDNGAIENIRSMFRGRKDVEVIKWPFHKCQLQLVGWFLWVARSRCERVLHMDVDEFAMMGLGTKKEYASSTPMQYWSRRMEQRGWYSFKMNYILMRNNGYQFNPFGYVAEHYTQLAKAQALSNGKAVCSTARAYESGLVHSCGKINGRQASFFFAHFQNWEDVNIYPGKRDDLPLVVHFRERSWEEWVQKIDAGWVVGELVGDKGSGTLKVSKPNNAYMEMNASWEFTHFRKVWRRVMKEGKKWEKFAILNGAGCEIVRVKDRAVVGSCE